MINRIMGVLSTRPADGLRGVIEKMAGDSRAAGSYVNEELRLGVAWFGDEAVAPAWNAAKNVCLILCGEDFSGEASGGKPNDAHDYLLRRYEKLGGGFLSTLNGWFSGILVDLREEKVILFNDRYGFRRLYYSEDDGAFYFSSEAKVLFKVAPRTRQIDLQGLGELVSCGCALQNRTMFSGVLQLPGGSTWTFRPAQPADRQSYFQKENWERQPLLDDAEFYEALKSTFARVLPRYLRDSGRIGMSLTGGIDGRMIMAYARCAPGALPCYTFGGTYRECNDVRLARKVAGICEQPHRVIPVDGEFLRNFPDLVRENIRVSDGCMDVTGAAELYVNRIARNIAPNRLTGNYGSEIVRNNVAFRPQAAAPGLFAADFERHVAAASATYACEAACHPVSFIAFKQVPWHHYSRFSVEQAALRPRSPFLDNDLVALMYRDSEKARRNKDLSLRLIAEGNPALAGVPTDRGVKYQPVPVLTRASNLYHEFTARAEYAYDYGMPQWLAKCDHLLSPLQPERLFLGRHKFCHFRVWYRDQLASYLREVLLDSRSLGRPYLQAKQLRAMLEQHLSGRGNFTTAIHQVLALELIHRELIESN